MTAYFVDTEFYEDGYTIDLISLGVVSSDGHEFYAVNQEAKLHRVSPWVREHVLRDLPIYADPAWMTRKEIADKFASFIKPSTDRPRLWGYYADYDWVAICQLYGTMMGLPEHFPRFCMDLKQLSVLKGSPDHPAAPANEHNALADARWNKELYEFLMKLPYHTLWLPDGKVDLL